MQNKLFLIILILLLTGKIHAQNTDNAKVFLITLDGVRWQEVFRGTDASLLNNSDYTRNKNLLEERFQGQSFEENRKKLMPFFWNSIAEKGQIYGNRDKGNKMDLTNTMWFSYPGYSEILTGFPDDQNITSNDKIYNSNVTFLEKVNQLADYNGKVAAFCSWDVFPYIINDKRSGIPVNAGYMKATTTPLTAREELINTMQFQAPILWESVRLDVFTHYMAKEHIKKKHPELVYIAYGETDDFAHGGHFDFYINAIHNTDGLIQDLWETVQNDPFYKDKTYFVITTDHGRGTGAEDSSLWTGHGSSVRDSNQTWLAIIGPQMKPKGEVVDQVQIYTNQIAATILDLLNVTVNRKDMGESLIDRINE